MGKTLVSPGTGEFTSLASSLDEVDHLFPQVRILIAIPR